MRLDCKVFESEVLRAIWSFGGVQGVIWCCLEVFGAWRSARADFKALGGDSSIGGAQGRIWSHLEDFGALVALKCSFLLVSAHLVT